MYVTFAYLLYYAMQSYVYACHSSTPVSTQVSLNAETLWAGLVSCLLVYPFYLLIFFLFRLSRSKVHLTHTQARNDF